MVTKQTRWADMLSGLMYGALADAGFGDCDEPSLSSCVPGQKERDKIDAGSVCVCVLVYKD